MIGVNIPRYADTVICGGGTAGAVVAGLLAERSDESILVLEAGPDYGPLAGNGWPVELRDAIRIPTTHDWAYDSGSCYADRVVAFERARVVGGCSAHNGCAAIWGSRRDYDAWAADGNTGWATADLLPLFRAANQRLRVRQPSPEEITVKITFKEASLTWYNAFTGTAFGAVYPAHFWGGDPNNTDAINQFRQAPIGTGPYIVESFSENDQVIYAINENYREPNKPYFSRVNLKGGGDAAAAARAVLETGDWHMAWNLQVEPQVLAQMEGAGKGKLITVAGTSVERLLINFSDPNTEVNGQRSQKDTPHPFLSDLAVRQALAAACDRQVMSEQFYEGPPGEPPAVNILTGIAAIESPNTSWEFNVEKAKQILDEAGWVMDGDTRSKDGVELNVTYSTSINAVRQKEQAVNKQAWEELGFKVQLKQVDAGIFFDSAAGNEQNASHFYNDLEMYTNNPATPLPTSYMASWYGGPDGSNIAQKENGWSGLNESRWSNAEYDALYDSLQVETDAEAAAESFIRMNDILINEVVIIPLVQRAAAKFAIANTLNPENIAASDWEVLYWNIANWNEVS